MKIFIASLITFFYNEIITHIPSHFLRKLYLRVINKKISSSSVILMHVKILGIWNLEVGDRSVINQNCLLDCRKYKIKISNDVDIGAFSKIWTLGHDPNSEQHDLYGGESIIEDHVWIASGVTLLPNLSIGRGAVIGANSLVTSDVKTMQIVAGSPAKFVRERKNSLNYKLNYKPMFE